MKINNINVEIARYILILSDGVVHGTGKTAAEMHESAYQALREEDPDFYRYETFSEFYAELGEDWIDQANPQTIRMTEAAYIAAGTPTGDIFRWHDTHGEIIMDLERGLICTNQEYKILGGLI